MQTTYSYNRVAGVEGAVAQGYPSAIVTGWVDETDGIKPGRFVRGTGTDGDVELPDATGEVTAVGSLRGVSVLDFGREALPNGVYADNEPLPILRKGRVFMVAEDAVTADTPVFVRFSVSGSEELGRVRSDADGTDAVAAPGCSFVTSTTGNDELCVVEVNLA